MSTGQTLTGTYSYSDVDDDGESGSTFKWFRSTDISGSDKASISGANGVTYTLVSEDEGAFISFEVTPADGISSGTAVESTLRGPVKAPVSATLTINDTSLALGQSTLITVSFSRAVTGLTNDDVLVENGTLTGLGSSDGGVTWTATLTPGAGIEEPENTIEVNLAGVTDDDGLAGAGVVSSVNFAIDTKRPEVTIAVSDDGLRSTESATVTFTFNETVTGFSAEDVVVENGTLSAIASGDGITWTATFTPSSNVEDPANVVAVDQSSVTDLAGNTGSGVVYSGVYAIDTKAPAAPGMPDLPASGDTGDSNTDNLTNTTTPDLTGVAEANSTVTVSHDGTVIGSVATDAGGRWIMSPGTPLAEGTHRFTVVATDAAGNVSVPSPSLTVIVDTTPPTSPSAADLDAGSDSGASDTDNITSDNTPEWSGFAEAAATVTIASDRDGALGSVTADGATGAWTFTPTALSQGTHVISATSTDAAGNEGSVSQTFNLTIDQEAPTATNIGDQTIPVGGNTGALSFTVSDNATSVGHITVDAETSNPNVAPPGGLTIGGSDTNRTIGVTGASSGTATITVTLTDMAGNRGVETFLVRVNTAPVINGTPILEVNQDVAYRFVPTASDSDGADELTFSIQNKPSWAGFDVATGALTGTPRRDDVGAYKDIIITVSDGIASSSLEPFVIEVTYVNAQPSDMLLSSAGIEENQPAGTRVGTLTTLDPDVHNTHTYLLVAGAGSTGNEHFYIDGNELFARTHFDAEVTDRYQIRIQTNDGDGGTLEKTFEVRVTDLEDARIFIPNLFTPNGDGNNETFRVRANGVSEIALRVFDRWGNMVYHTTDVDAATEVGWNGSYQGRQQPSGTYVWQVIGTFTDGTPILYDGQNTGNITLIR